MKAAWNQVTQKSWVDEVEDEANEPSKKKSVWDDFDITKLVNLEYKLEYVTPTKNGEIAEIKIEDIKYEIIYWGNVVVFYELGAHPPLIGIQ